MTSEFTAIETGRLAELAALIEKYSTADGIHATAVKGLRCIKLSAPNMKLPAVYEPSVCVIVQGSKQVLLEHEIYRYAPPQFLAVSVDLPLVGQVLEASEARLQYHKRLRLTEARHILLSENADAASTAYRVGYESTAQFSREYARMFGAPPMRDIAAMREAR